MECERDAAEERRHTVDYSREGKGVSYVLKMTFVKHRIDRNEPEGFVMCFCLLL